MIEGAEYEYKWKCEWVISIDITDELYQNRPKRPSFKYFLLTMKIENKSPEPFVSITFYTLSLLITYVPVASLKLSTLHSDILQPAKQHSMVWSMCGGYMPLILT